MSLIFLAHVACHLALCRMSNLRNGHVALSILVVERQNEKRGLESGFGSAGYVNEI